MNSQDLGIFGPLHLAVLAATPLLGWVLGRLGRGHPRAARMIRLFLAWSLIVNEITTQIHRYQKGWLRFPDMLPLQLSDLTLWLTIAALLTLRKPLLDIAYYLGIAGAGNAAITPEFFEPITSQSSIQFLIAHAGVVVAALFIVWSGLHRPRPGSLWRAFAVVNAWAVTVGIFNAIYQTNYMFLCRKPATASLLDSFGPWPVYVIVTELVGLALFVLLWLPYRKPQQLATDQHP